MTTTHAIKNLDHLGLVAGMCQELQIQACIDAIIPKSNDHHVTHGQALVAMIINWLCFHSRTLHMFPDFFADKPTERLIGEGVLPEHLNDDALGRCLDALYATDVSVLYEILAARVVKKLGMKEAHDNRYLVADAALYASDTLRDLHRQGQRFITRVPLMLSEAKAHVQGLHTQALTALDNGYSGRCVSSTYAGVDWHQYGVSSFALNGSTILAANGATPFAP